MTKKSKLLAALDTHRGIDYKLERQKKQRKEADKRKKSRQLEPSNAENEGRGSAPASSAFEGQDIESDVGGSEGSECAASLAVSAKNGLLWHFHAESKLDRHHEIRF